MALVIRSEPALEDFHDIWRYIARENIGAADRLIARIDEKLKLYAEFPGMGTACDQFADGLRSFPVGNYLVFYRIVPGGIILLRVLHGARDINSLFEK